VGSPIKRNSSLSSCDAAHLLCTGYVAMGFSDVAGRMGPADAYVGWVDASGAAQVVDFTTNSRSVNAPDPQQDVSAVSATMVGGMLTVTFTRKLDTKACLLTLLTILFATFVGGTLALNVIQLGVKPHFFLLIRRSAQAAPVCSYAHKHAHAHTQNTLCFPGPQGPRH
jgi:hypothetical protein